MLNVVGAVDPVQFRYRTGKVVVPEPPVKVVPVIVRLEVEAAPFPVTDATLLVDSKPPVSVRLESISVVAELATGSFVLVRPETVPPPAPQPAVVAEPLASVQSVAAVPLTVLDDRMELPVPCWVLRVVVTMPEELVPKYTPVAGAAGSK